MQKIYTKIESIVGNVVTVRAEGVRNGDLALVGDSYANVIKLDIFRFNPFCHIKEIPLMVIKFSSEHFIQRFIDESKWGKKVVGNAHVEVQLCLGRRLYLLHLV